MILCDGKMHAYGMDLCIIGNPSEAGQPYSII